MGIVLSICIGVGLSAACGFRIFVPFLIVSIASLSGHLQLTGGFEWIGTWPALLVFAVATAIEIGTDTVRLTSTVTTAGFGNPIVATVEAVGSTILSVVSIVVPILAAVLVVALAFFIGRAMFGRRLYHRKA